MPYMIVSENGKHCVHKENPDGTAGENVKCHETEQEAKDHMRALYSNAEDMAAKYMEIFAVKAVGDWELDVLAIPFNIVDSDGQWFDENTEIMEGAFQTPIGIYQHGVKQGAKQLDKRPLVVADAVSGSLEKRSDGWHIRYILNKTLDVARSIMDAAKKKMVAVSSDSIAHLARLDVGGKSIMYEKDRPGRIDVWPLAGVSMWEIGNGNLRPANRSAYAMPVMKAMYRDAGLQFPSIESNVEDTNGAKPEADNAVMRAKIKQQAQAYLLLGE